MELLLALAAAIAVVVDSAVVSTAPLTDVVESGVAFVPVLI